MELSFVVAVAAAHGVLVGAEIAILATTAPRARDLSLRGRPGARELAALRARPERVLATTRGAMALLAALAGVVGGHLVARALAACSVAALGRFAEPASLLGALGLVGGCFATVGYLVPQALVGPEPARFALGAARLVGALAGALAPFAWATGATSKGLLRLVGARPSLAAPAVTEDAAHDAVAEASSAGVIDARAGGIARRAIDFGRLTAEDVMVPRTDVVALPVRASIDELHRVLLETGHSRLPVYGASIDEVLGYISAKDVLALSVERALFVVQDLIRPAYFVPVSMPAPALLDELRARAVHLAFVTDAEGGLAGIVTMEDLLEELVGEIASEHDAPSEGSMRPAGEGTLVVDGAVHVRDVNRELEVDLPESDDWSTVAGLCIALAGHIPQAGERLRSEDGTALEVLDASHQRVLRVKVSRAR